jgi:hypothetical protein
MNEEKSDRGDWRVAPHFPEDKIAKLNESLPADEPNLSYFFQFYRYLHETYGTTILKEIMKEQCFTPTTFREYDHPTWANWDEIWAKPPISLDPELIGHPSIECAFNSTLYRLELVSCYFFGIGQDFCIRQGTTFEFKGYENPDIRFVVEWCQWTKNHDAYLKVVGVNLEGHFFPPTDPDFPSFILIVPECVVDVPAPTSSLPCHPSYPLTLDEMELYNEFNFCWACNTGYY